ncbi:MAG: gamma carbonic anhydrase family protein [Candidatus Brocadiia bacterium]
MGPLSKILRHKASPAEPDTFAYIAPTAAVLGDVHLGEDVSIWYSAVLRGDEAPIIIRDGTNVQDNASLHCDPGVPLVIGSYVTIGHGAILHCESIGDKCIIGMGAVILGGASIGESSLVGAGSLVTPNKKFPPRCLILGSPAKVVRELTEAEVEKQFESAMHYIQLARSGQRSRSYGE